MFWKIDNWLFDALFQPWSDDFQRVTGHTCFLLAALFVGATAVLGTITIVMMSDEHNFSPASNIGITLGAVTVWVTVIGLIVYYLRCNRNAREGSMRAQTMNASRGLPYLMGIRVSIVCMELTIVIVSSYSIFSGEGNAVQLLGAGFALCCVAFLYFSACTPKPKPPMREVVGAPIAQAA